MDSLLVTKQESPDNSVFDNLKKKKKKKNKPDMGENGYIYIYGWVPLLKLSQHCELAIPQYKINSLKFGGKKKRTDRSVLLSKAIFKN